MRNSYGLRTVKASLQAARTPFIYWDFTSSAAPLLTNRAFPSLTPTGSPDFATRAGWVTLDDTSYYTASQYATDGMKALFDLGEGAMLFWARVNVAAASSGQQHLLSIGAGAGPQIRFNIGKSSTFRPDVWIAFDGDASATQYAGGSNEFAGDTDTNVALLIDNRAAVKTLYRYVNGANLGGTTWSGKGACTPSNAVTQRVRIFADALNTAGSTLQGAVHNMGLVNFGTVLPEPWRINDIIQDLHVYNGQVPAVLAGSL